MTTTRRKRDTNITADAAAADDDRDDDRDDNSVEAALERVLAHAESHGESYVGAVNDHATIRIAMAARKLPADRRGVDVPELVDGATGTDQTGTPPAA